FINIAHTLHFYNTLLHSDRTGLTFVCELKLEEKEAKLFCHHGDSSYTFLYWYQLKRNGGSLELIGMLQYGTDSEEEKFKPRFNITGDATKDAFLLISNINTEDSAVYFCAASLHSRTIPFNR
uniref:Ig-like domain-containing protein n=1 Tax=Sinocyclocheilus anshuiensis TaxID=1608454 RepID=A0A671SDD6_9TELE